MQSVQKLDYLLAVINKGLRLSPPVPGNLRRVTPREGPWITRWWIPGNVDVAVDIYALPSIHTQINGTYLVTNSDADGGRYILPTSHPPGLRSSFLSSG
jgi:hypothetical protein